MNSTKSPKPINESIEEMLNKTGVFLERKVLISLMGSNFAVRREEPYELITASGEEPGTIDILAACPTGAGFILCLCIECKKANPDQKHWVFEREEPKDFNARYQQETYHFVYYDSHHKSKGKSPVVYGVEMSFRSLGYQSLAHLDRAIAAFEFNDTDGKLSRNGEEKAYNAIQQAHRAMAGVNPHMGLDRLKKMLDLTDDLNVLYIPLVVTTANLWVSDYSTGDVSWKTGMLNTAGLSLHSRYWVHYNFPLPLSLQIDGISGTPNKRPTFVVNAEHFEEFIKKLLIDCQASFFART